MGKDRCSACNAPWVENITTNLIINNVNPQQDLAELRKTRTHKLRKTRLKKIQDELREMNNQTHKSCFTAQWKTVSKVFHYKNKSKLKRTKTVWYDVEIVDTIDEGCSDKFPGRGYKVRPVKNVQNRRKLDGNFERFVTTVEDVKETDIKRNP